MESAIQVTGWFAFFAVFLGFLFTSDPRRKRRFGWISVALAVALSIHAATPLGDRELVPFFDSHASGKDKNYEEFIAEVRQKSEGFGGSQYALLKSIVTERKLDLRRYFPDVQVPEEKRQTLASANEWVLLEVQRRAGGRVRLGLDLQGGTSFLLELETKDASALEEAKSVILRRVDALGLAEPIVQPVGSDRILIQLPGVSEAQREEARRTVQQASYLELRLVHPDNEEFKAKLREDPNFRPVGCRKFEGWTEVEKGRRVRDIYFLELVPMLKGEALKHAMQSLDQYGRPSVAFELKSEASAQFARLTEQNKGRLLAIVLDNEVRSAPVIREAITGGRGEITGKFDYEETKRLANVLNNPLQTPARLIEERNVDASLGKDSIRSGVTAGIVGATAVLVFIAIYYMSTGLIANIAVVLNVVILIGILALFQFTLTLPGMAGIVLTIGMAVDANVLINERIREELRAGKALRLAISTGYGKAFWTIFDSNLTTLITAGILIMMGSGPVKGFGITLTIGLLVNMFTAIVFTRLVVDFLVDRGWATRLPMLHIIGHTKIDFLRFRHYAVALSVVLVLFGTVAFVRRGGLEGLLPEGRVSSGILSIVHKVIPRGGPDVFGIDFKGGVAVTLNFDQEQKVESGEVTRALEGVGLTDTVLQYQRELDTGREILQIKTAAVTERQHALLAAAGVSADTINAGTGRIVQEVLTRKFPNAQFKVAALEEVGSIVGKELKWEALLAMGVACVLIMIYVALRFEFGFGLGAIVALLHDTLITVGFFALSGRQFSLPMVAAILTIIGFSINDSIVIFDRIREDLKLYSGRMSFKDIVNRSLNETLARTILTSFTVLLVTVSLYVFGGGIINDFAFAFIVGIITGVYSSIFIASSVLVWWHGRQRPAEAAPAVLFESKARQRA